MTTFLLLISLLLNGVAIFLIIILFTRQNRLTEAEEKQEKLLRDVEEIISSSLLEMKEENEEFIKQFKSISSQNVTQVTEPVKVIKQDRMIHEAGIGNNVDQHNHEWVEKKGTISKKQAAMVYKSATSIEKKTNSDLETELLPDWKKENDVKLNLDNHSSLNVEAKPEVSQEELFRDLFMNQVLLLQNQGLSAEKIAKKLGKGKTEIELLLKFR
ncbi:MAG: hypothetical protein Q8934_00435 [Bacillota bacterium]|nr:hypothetical protein [Bacillota bacterium]